MNEQDRHERLKWFNLSRHILIPEMEKKLKSSIGRMLGEYRAGNGVNAGIVGEISAYESLIKTIQQGSDEFEREESNNG